MKLSPYLAILFSFLNSGCDQKSAVAVENAAPLTGLVTFNAHIRPIFSNTCFACHGFDAKKREADLRLDTPEGAYAKLKDSEEHAIVPGKPDQSAILKRIVSKDPEEVMPPKDFHKDLTENQKSLIRAWIQQGAKYEQHWAFTPLVKPAVPTPANHADEVANPIDNFILTSLEHKKLAPAPLADRATLLRRLSLDLTGLPPSPEELDTYQADPGPDAYAKQVERLLASPHYGERMAVPWLDIVRFADTVGYHGDQNVRVFPYRDYVIKSFNDNKRFDQFTTEQLAGDLLPHATDEQRIATGFLRLNMMTREGGAQDKEYLAKSMGDRVRAVGAAWLGLTTGCCECHDHKFDPITARDFYSLGAFFADVRQWGVYSDYKYTPNPDLSGFSNDSPFPPELYSKNAAVEARLALLQKSAAGILAALRTEKDEAGFQQWSRHTASFLAANPSGWMELTPTLVTPSQGTAHEVSPDHSELLTGPPKKEEIITLEFPLPDEAMRSIRFDVLPDPKNAGKTGRQQNGKFSVTPIFSVDNQPLKIAWSQADRRTAKAYHNGDSDPLLEAEWRSAPASWEEPQDAAALPHTALYHLAETLPATAGRILQVRLASADVGRVKFSITPFGDAVPGQDSAPQGELAAAWVLATTPDARLPESYLAVRKSIIGCRAGYAYCVVAQALPADKILSTHVLPRGA